MSTEMLKILSEVLKRTREDSEILPSSILKKENLEELGLLQTEDKFVINRTERIDLAKRAIQIGARIGDIVELLTWKDFEGFVAAILISNNYKCVESFRRRGNSLMHGMEIDVIGVKGMNIIAIDAKMWGARTGKASALKTAAEKQKNRTQELSVELDRLADKLGSLEGREYQLFPVIVTWLVEEVELHEGVPVVPIFKLNSFILNLHQYEDLIASCSGNFNSSD